MTTETATEIDLITPITDDWWPLIWEWLHQCPDMNFDDDGICETYDAFVLRHKRLMADGGRTWGATLNGDRVGYGSFMPLNSRIGVAHIVLDMAAQGRGIALAAVRLGLTDIFAQTGIDKIQSCCYADNVRVRRLLHALGGVEEGWLRAQAMRRGEPVDMVMVAVFREGLICQTAAR